MEEQAEIRHEEILELLQQANGTRSVSQFNFPVVGIVMIKLSFRR
jgi:hypothetical protein